MNKKVLGIFTNPVHVEGLCTHTCACQLTCICKGVFKVWDLIPSFQNMAPAFAKFSSKDQQQGHIERKPTEKEETESDLWRRPT